jgi:predicted nuclease of restriction endonuclease-like RecB superfamily
MLTRELAIADYDNGRLIPDRLGRQRHAHYGVLADRVLEVYRTGIGQTRRELHQAVHAAFAAEEDCPSRRIDAFCKLLDDVSTFAQGRPGEAAALRREVFHRAAALHPLVRSADRSFPHEESAVKTSIAAELGRAWEAIDAELFADVPECHRLESFAGYPSGDALLARYNVAQVQVALYRATELVVWASEDFKTILRYAKLAGLMHTIRRHGEASYEIRLDGPASVLHATRRYGIAFARFLPALIACRGWRLHAVLQTRRPGWLLSLDLTGDDGLSSHLPAPAEFDSRVEARFTRRWGVKREGWSLDREGAILHHEQKVFVPDFVLRHDDGRTALLEIIGFWTPEYLAAKFRTLRLFADQPILVAVARPAQRHLADLPPLAIAYKTVLRPEQVLERLRNHTPPRDAR